MCLIQLPTFLHFFLLPNIPLLSSNSDARMYASSRTITYDTADPVQCTVDVYEPLAPGPGRRDAVVFIHGGAWRA